MKRTLLAAILSLFALPALAADNYLAAVLGNGGATRVITRRSVEVSPGIFADAVVPLNPDGSPQTGGGAGGVADGSSFTASTSLFILSGGFYQTTATANALTNGQMGAWQFTANRAGFVNLRNASGTEVGTSGAPLRVDPTGTTTQPVSAVSLPLPTGAATAANQSTANTSLSTIATNTTGAATAANQTTANTSLSTIATNTTGAATAANQTTANSSLSTIATNTTGAATAANQSTANTSLANIDTSTAAPLDANGNTKSVLYKPDDTAVDWNTPDVNTTTAASVTGTSSQCYTADSAVQELVAHALDANTQAVDIRLGTTAATVANATDRLLPGARVAYHWSGGVTCISVSGTQAVTFSAMK